jgi:hypothetical protein
MWMYLWPSCLDCSFFAELDDAEIDARIQRIHALGAHRNPDPSLIPLREGVVSP